MRALQSAATRSSLTDSGGWQAGGIVLTRIDPLRRETSMLVRIRPGWEAMREFLSGDDRQPAPAPGAALPSTPVASRRRFEASLHPCPLVPACILCLFALCAWHAPDKPGSNVARATHNPLKCGKSAVVSAWPYGALRPGYGARRQIFVCTMSEGPYAREMCRLLDPQARRPPTCSLC